MKKSNTIVVIILSIVIALFLLLMYVYTFSKTQDIDKLGTFFGGIGSVIIGLITTVLLLITMFKQDESGQIQNIKNETEFALALYNQMERDFEAFYSKYHRGKEVLAYQGQEALNQFVHNYVYGNFPEHLSDYGGSFDAMQLHGILKSFHLIKTRTKEIPVSSTIETRQAKLDIFYVTRLEYTCKCFTNAFIEHNSVLDDKAKFVVAFYDLYKSIRA